MNAAVLLLFSPFILLLVVGAVVVVIRQDAEAREQAAMEATCAAANMTLFYDGKHSGVCGFAVDRHGNRVAW